MTPDNKHTIYWTSGTMAAILTVLVILWAMGVFQVAPVQ